MTNVVIGIYNGYDSIVVPKGGIYFFLNSLRKHNKTCKVIILCQQQYHITCLKEICQDLNAEIYSDFSFDELPVLIENMDNLKENQFLTINLVYRFIIFKKILESMSEEINSVLMTDVSDVIFQGDPFEIDSGEELYCAMEKNVLSDNANYSSLLNMQWINQFKFMPNFNTECFDNKLVACAGTIYGKYKPIMEYLAYYKDLNEYRFCNDQGLYNIYVHDIKKLSVLPYTESRILTLDKMEFSELKKDDKGRLVNNKGELYNIIHQACRCNYHYMLSLA